MGFHLSWEGNTFKFHTQYRVLSGSLWLIWDMSPNCPIKNKKRGDLPSFPSPLAVLTPSSSSAHGLFRANRSLREATAGQQQEARGGPTRSARARARFEHVAQTDSVGNLSFLGPSVGPFYPFLVGRVPLQAHVGVLFVLFFGSKFSMSSWPRATTPARSTKQRQSGFLPPWGTTGTTS